MEKFTDYHFSDFTLENYKYLLKLGSENYQFTTFNDFSTKDNYIILRHDVDYSVHRALKMAKIESSLGIKSTYFFLLHSEFYNLFERSVADKVEEIISLGHDIGLHFDSHFYKIPSEEVLISKLTLEKDIIESFFSAKINSFCFHITNSYTINCNKEEYAGMINAFSYGFQNNIGYCSDSNGYWRFSRLEDVLTEQRYNKLQINTHPAWWQDEVMAPKKRILRSIYGRSERVIEAYNKILIKTGRDDIDE